MNTKRFNIYAYLLLLAIIISSSACSLSSISAKSPNHSAETARTENNTDSAKNEYKPPRRISRDVIKKNEKPKTEEKSAKSKTK
jgi:hypothetical protein